MKWIYADQSGVQHEIEESEFPSLIASDTVTSDTLVWNETMSDWRPCGEIRPDLFGDVAVPPPLSQAERKQVQAHAPQTSGGAPPIHRVSLWAMIFGIVGITSCIPLFSIPAVIYGHLGIKKANAEPGNSANKGFAITGIITGYIGIFFLIVAVIFIIAGIAMDGSASMEGLEEFESLDEP